MSRICGTLLTIISIFVCVRPNIAAGQDIGEVLVERIEYFSQCTTNRADVTMDRGHWLESITFPASAGSVFSSTVATPNHWSLALSNTGSVFLTNLSFSSPAPAGTYVFHVTTANQGTQSLKVSLPGTATGIPPMRVANFSSAQAVDANQDFTLTWDKVSKYNRYDFIKVYVFNTNGSVAFSLPKLDISETNAVIPAGTLEPATSYNAYLYLRHYFSLQNSRLPMLAATELKATRFALKTLNSAGVFQFSPSPIVAREQDGMATIAVQRTQGSTGKVTVDYFSSDDTAKSGINYSTSSGTLEFPDGVTNQTITVPLLQSATTNLPLRFRVYLTNATAGAAVVTRPHTTVTVLDSVASTGPNVNAYMLARVRFYDQPSASLPNQSNRCDAARFYASIHPKFTGAVTNAVLRLPNHTAIPMPNDGGFMECNFDFPSVASMNTKFVGGKYQMSFNTLTDGAFSPTLNFGAERLFAIPYVTNWLALQTADPSTPVTIRWAPFVGAATNDYVTVSLRDPSGEYIFRTPSEFEPGALKGATSSITIPAGIMEYGKPYLGNLMFSKMVEGKPVYPGIHNGIASVHTTIFYIHTKSIAPSPLFRNIPDTDCPCCAATEPVLLIPDMDEVGQ